ncbi:tetratricopeptide repeat protein [Micromonospora matsumotoense]|uniref:tetratricopeptide repeat protein n=1 Tax=Micromonospora matsumotoense TaxID=121616 RepID=UPI003D8F06B3
MSILAPILPGDVATPGGCGVGETGREALLADRRVLVLLDNARDADQVRPLLPSSPGCLVLVTSRNQLPGLVTAEGARPLPLGLLSPAEGRELLSRRLGAGRVAAEPEAVDRIVAAAAGLPLALAIVAARAASYPDFRLDRFAAELTASRGALDAFNGVRPASTPGRCCPGRTGGWTRQPPTCSGRSGRTPGPTCPCRQPPASPPCRRPRCAGRSAAGGAVPAARPLPAHRLHRCSAAAQAPRRHRPAGGAPRDGGGRAGRPGRGLGVAGRRAPGVTRRDRAGRRTRVAHPRRLAGGVERQHLPRPGGRLGWPVPCPGVGVAGRHDGGGPGRAGPRPPHRAIACLRLGAYDEAHEHLERSRQLYAELGDYPRALDYCGQALVRQQQTGNRYWEAHAWDSLGFAHHHLGRHRDALDCYRQARR